VGSRIPLPLTIFFGGGGGVGRCCCLVFGGEGVGVLRVGVVDFVCLGGGGVVVLPLCGVGLWGLDLGSVLFWFKLDY